MGVAENMLANGKRWDIFKETFQISYERKSDFDFYEVNLKELKRGNKFLSLEMLHSLISLFCALQQKYLNDDLIQNNSGSRW